MNVENCKFFKRVNFKENIENLNLFLYELFLAWQKMNHVKKIAKKYCWAEGLWGGVTLNFQSHFKLSIF